jgi:hypothetical protein
VNSTQIGLDVRQAVVQLVERRGSQKTWQTLRETGLGEEGLTERREPRDPEHHRGTGSSKKVNG